MSRKNWDKIADQQFASLSQDEQEFWSDLRQIARQNNT